MSRDGALVIKKITAAVDAGTIINLSAAEAQVQGAILDGISAAWFQKTTIEGGAAAKTNFNDYPMLRMSDSPRQMEVHFVKSDAPPTGLGEAGSPPLRLQSATRSSQRRASAFARCRSSARV